MGNKWMLLLLKVQEEELPAGNAYTALPDALDRAVSTVMPNAVELETVYLLNKKQKNLVEKMADDNAINYHHHAVTVRGEECKEENCEQHPLQNVLSFNDHRRGNRNPPGVN